MYVSLPYEPEPTKASCLCQLSRQNLPYEQKIFFFFQLILWPLNLHRNWDWYQPQPALLAEFYVFFVFFFALDFLF